MATHHVEKNIIEKLESKKNKNFIINVLEALNKIKIKGNKNFLSIDYKTQEAKNIYKFIFKSNFNLVHDFDENWNFGGYTIKEFRMFFAAIQAIALVHNIFLFNIYKISKQDLNTEKLFQNLVSFKNKKKWIKLIKFFADIEDYRIENMINELTYNFSRANYKNKIGVTSYCFYPIGDNILALSNVITRSSYAERNIWLMLSRNKKGIHSKLSTLKEGYWKQGLIDKLVNEGLWCFDKSIKIDSTDIDLLLIDFKNNFGLSIELKWLTQSNRPIDYELIDKELSKGQKQALLCEKWINNNKKELADKINLNINKLSKIDFKSIVLSKNSIGSAKINDNYIPITSEDLFWWILSYPLKKDIKSLYKIINEKKFYPKINKHYIKRDITINYAGYNFLERKSYLSNGKWNYLKDIF